MDTGVLAAVITGIGGMLAGLYGILKFMTVENSKTQKSFLEHLEKKNGHTERIANKFTQSVDKLTDEVNRSNENHANIRGVLSSNNEIISKVYDKLK
jgi:hypothetical protein